MNERDVTVLLERRAAAVPASDPPIETIVDAARRDSGGHRHRVAFLAAAAALALIVGAGIAWDAAQDESAPPPPTDAPLPFHEGYRWVGMNGIALEVPATWTTSDRGCAPAAVDTVVFGYPGRDICQDPRVDPQASSLHFETLDSRNFIAETAPTGAQHQVSIGGLPALVTDPIELNCPRATPAACTSVFGSSVEIDSPDAGFLLVWIESPDRATVVTTMGSIRAIPDGYSAVPSMSGQVQSKAADMLGALGLAPQSLCPRGGDVCDGDLRVLQTDPPAGSVVRANTSVAMLAAAPRNDDAFAAASVRIGGRLEVVVYPGNSCTWSAGSIEAVGMQHVVLQLDIRDLGTVAPQRHAPASCFDPHAPSIVRVEMPVQIDPRQPVIVELSNADGSEPLASVLAYVETRVHEG